MRRSHLLTSALVLWLPSLLIAAEPVHGNVVLVLEGGLARDDRRMDIVLELPCRNGAWPEKCWGYAVRYNRGYHEGVVTGCDLAGGAKIWGR